MNSSNSDDNKFERLPVYTPGETIANIITHGLGLALSIFGLVVLVRKTTIRGDLCHIVSTVIYGSTLPLLYGVSTV